MKPPTTRVRDEIHDTSLMAELVNTMGDPPAHPGPTARHSIGPTS
jgi:hypothetical protein